MLSVRLITIHHCNVSQVTNFMLMVISTFFPNNNILLSHRGPENVQKVRIGTS